MTKNSKAPAPAKKVGTNTASNKNKFIEIRALNSMMKTRYENEGFGTLTIPNFDAWDAAVAVYYYCKNLSNRFANPKIWVPKNSNHAFVVASAGGEVVMLDPTALREEGLGEPIKLLKNIYDFSNYGKEFNKYELDDYMVKYSNLININPKEIECGARELGFLG